MESRGAGIDSNAVFSTAVGRKCPLKLFYLRPKNKRGALEDTGEYRMKFFLDIAMQRAQINEWNLHSASSFLSSRAGLPATMVRGRDIASNHAARAHDRALADRNSAQNC